MIADCLFVIFASLASALFAEGISWLLIYRTDEYKRLKSTIDKLQNKVDKKKQEAGVVDNSASSSSKIKDKKIGRFEESLQNANRDMATTKFKSTFAVAFSMIALFGVLNSTFDGIVVAKLPFEPISLINGISHRGLSGTDYTDCSMVFFYILCSLSIRANIQKLFGTTPPKQMSGWPS